MAIAKLSIDIEARLASFEQQLDKVAKASEGMAGRVKSSFSALGSTVGMALGALATAGAVGQFKELVNYLDQFDEAAERIGTSAENLSALAYAAKQNGLEFEELNKGLVKFSSLLADAAGGNKEAIALLNRLGVSAENYNDLDKALDQTANSFAKFENGVAKTALASDAFGDKLGSKMVPLLNQGAEGMAALRQEAEQLGGIINDKLAKQAAEFNDNLDKLATISSTLGKSLANELLPSLNALSVEFIEGMRNSDGFLDALMKYGLTNPFKDHATKLTELRAEFEQLDFILSNGRSKNEEEDKKRFRSLEQQINYYERLKKLQSGESFSQARAGVVSVPAKVSTAKTKTIQPEATAEAKAYADAMEALAKTIQTADMATLGLSGSQQRIYELMTSPVWDSMPETWRQTAVAQFEQAYAAEQAASAAARLNRLLADTDSAKIEEARDDMLALAEALEKGIISEEKYLEAVAARLGKGTEEIKKQKSLTEELGLTFTSAFEDAVVGGKKFSDVLKGLEQDVLRILARKAVTEPLAKASSDIWGSIVKSLFGSTTVANAKGGVYSSPSLSAYSGGVYDSPQLFAFANGAGVFGEAGPEAIMPLKRGKDGKLGVSAEGGGGDVTVIVNNNTDAQTRTEKRSDGRGGSIIEVVVEQAVNRVASNIASGNGAVPAALQSTYGLKRSHGAY